MTATASRESGRMLAERLGLTIFGTEGHDLKVKCIACDSSDAARVHSETGVYFCFSCNKPFNAFDLCKVVLGDHEAAKRLMHEVGLFPELFEVGKGAGNGKTSKPASNGDKRSDTEIIDELARHKGTTGDGFRAYGAIVQKGKVLFPTFRLLDGKAERISYFYIDPKNPSDKGRNAEGKPAGIFLPVIPAATAADRPRIRRPQPGELWLMGEGAKNGSAYHSLGFNAIGLNGKHVKREFLPGFIAGLKGTDLVLTPDGDLQSVEAFKKLGAAAVGTAKSVRLASLPYDGEFRDTGGNDVRDILKRLGDAGPDAVRKAIAEALPVNAKGETVEVVDYGFVSGPDLLSRDCRVEYLIPGVLAKGQHCLLGAPLKACKSLIAIDQAIALATGGVFLGRFHVPRPVRTLLVSLESGWPVLQENIRRISQAAGVAPEQLGNLFIAIRGPKFGQPEHMDAIAEDIKRLEAEVVIFDCAYRCIPGDVASNVLSMGELLDSVGSVFETCGATMELVHHSPKHIPPGEPLQLDNLAFAGFAEFAAQWLLLNRRTAYQPGSGHHDLWLTIGARAGHGGLYGLTIDEGEFHQGQDREWRAEVTQAGEVWKETRDTKAKAREAKRLEKLEEIRKRIIDTAAKYKAGESKTVIRDETGLADKEFKAGFAALLADGDLVACEVQKPNRKTPYPGYLLALYANP